MAALLRLLACVSVLVSSGVAAEGTRWACWYAPGSETVRCLLEQAPAGAAAEQLAGPGNTVDPRLPALVRTIRQRPDELTGRQVSIPMWTPPLEMDFVRELAVAVMCGNQHACAVAFDANADGRAALRAAIRVADRLDGERQIAFAATVLDSEMIDGQAAASAEPPAPRPARRRRSGNS